MSNALTGYIEPKYKKMGYDFAHKIIVSETYCPARYTNKDLENSKQYMYRKNIEQFGDKLTYPFELLNFKKFNLIKIEDKFQLANFLIQDSNVRLARFKEIFSKPKARVHDFVLKEKFKECDQWYKYDINGEPCEFILIHQKSGDRESFTWKGIEKLAVKLYSKNMLVAP